MPHRPLTSSGWLGAVLCAFVLTGAVPAASAAITVGIVPANKSVPPGSDFDVYLNVTQAGSLFNGFSAVVSYDPSALTLLPSAPSNLQEGCLMTGVCSDACGNTFHQFAAAGDSASINDYLFCNQIALTGPGDLYRLRFRAASTARVTNITLRRATFYNAGLLVNPVQMAGATIQIVAGLGVGDGSPFAHTLRVEPNPAFGRMQLVLEDGAAGLAQADIMDLQGRVVKRFAPTWFGPRARFEWDGTDGNGDRVSGGVYLARIQRGGAIQTSRFVLLR